MNPIFTARIESAMKPFNLPSVAVCIFTLSCIACDTSDGSGTVEDQNFLPETSDEGDASTTEVVDAVAEDGEGSAEPIPCDTTQSVVSFQTVDDVTLVADYLPATQQGAGVVVLLHMIPPGNDRSGYPQRVLDAFAELGLNVLNVDRRGAGDSGGVAQDAYEGPLGRFDVEAAVAFALDESGACPGDPTRVMLVGASNGTTSVMDYVVGHDSRLPDAAAIAWLSPGTYTENQNAIADHRDVLDALPILWVFRTAKATAISSNRAPPPGVSSNSEMAVTGRRTSTTAATSGNSWAH